MNGSPVLPALLLLILSLLALPARGETAHLGARHQPSGINSAFDFSAEDFADYRRQVRDMIDKARLDLDDNRRRDIIDGNLPFELLPASDCPSATKAQDDGRYPRGILLIHGLSDSPYSLRHLGEYFSRQCLYVVAILLPGHGTRPGDLLNVHWQDWQRAVDFGIKLVKRRADEIWLGGYSLGAALALNETQQNNGVHGLILVSPALQLPTLAAFAGIRQWFGRFDNESLWWQVLPDNDPYKYESFPVNGITQMYALIQALQPLLEKPPSLPLLIAASEDDATVDSRATLDLFKRWPAADKQLVWFSREMQPQAGRVEIVDSQVPDRHIASSSHVSLVMPADDPHYGANGDYTSCSHYYEEQPTAWRQCQARQEDLLAEITPYFLSQGIVRRITYNPHYDKLLKAITRFLKR
jgi:esterase/lipase